MQEHEKTPLPPQFDETVAGWQRSLLQLDRRNNLLYFRAGKTAVRIVDQTPDGVMTSLLSSQHGLTFDYAEPRSRRPGRQADQDEVEANEDSAPHIISGDLRGDCTPLDLQRRLGNLRRREREWREEQGLNILFLAIGFLEWVDEDGEQATAPLLLLPCRLDRVSPRDAFTLRNDEDDLTTNSTLAVKLGEFGIDLSKADSKIETAAGFLEAVRGLLVQRPDWKVHEDIYLSTFTYSKLAMWRDLELVKNNGTDHPVVLTLAGAVVPPKPDAAISSPYSQIPDDLSGGHLDDVLNVRDQFAVLPADYSQLLAITAARSLRNLVVHGPPGTGKSQTIANIIATFLAEGKSVLFVSEKTAAMDVVKRRLDEKRLGVFCLDLHSKPGNKASVYQQLQQSVDDSRTVPKLDFDYATLEQHRRQLNRVVRALHEVRQPLGRTVFEVHGRFALLRNAPHVDFEVKDVATLNQERVASILEIANRVALRRREFKEHSSSHWRVLKQGIPSLELGNTIRRDMQKVAAAATAAREAIPRLADALGLGTPSTLGEIIRLEQVARHLASGPGVPAAWLKDHEAKRLRDIAERETETQRTRQSLEQQLTGEFGRPVPAWDYGNIAEELAVPPSEQETLARLLGEDWSRLIIQNRQTTSRAIGETKAALHRLQSVVIKAAEFLGVAPPLIWPELSSLMGFMDTVSRIGPVPSEWVQSGGPDRVAGFMDLAEETTQQLDEVEAKVFSEFEPGVLDIVDRHMLARYRADHQNRLRRLVGSAYRSDRKALHSFQRVSTKLSFIEELDSVEDIHRAKELQAKWDAVAPDGGPLLERRYSGRRTDWKSVRQDLGEVKTLGQQWNGKAGRLEALLINEDQVRQCQELAADLHQAVSVVEGLMGSWTTSSLKEETWTGKMTLPSFDRVLGDAAPAVKRLEAAAAEPLAAAQAEIRDVGALRGLMEAGVQFRMLEREHEEASTALRIDFGNRFRDFETGWPAILKAITWVEGLLELTLWTDYQTADGQLKLISWEKGLPELLHEIPCTRFLGHVEHPQGPSEYNSIADSLSLVIRQFCEETEPLRERYDFDSGPWDAWESGSFDEIMRWTEALANDADSASDSLLYRRAVAELNNATGAATLEQIRQGTDDSTLVPIIVERRLIGAWLDWTYQQEPALADFAAVEQEDLIAKFKELDKQSAIAAQAEVRKRVFERYPNIYGNSNRASELGVLRGELSKRRRQSPVRKLFRAIPTLIQTLKPCFLVGPLAVSQYLPLSDLASETLTFDVVIFDEASQVFPEDSVPAILRGRQLILAGDQKQLPPSSFWRRSMAEGEGDYDDEKEEDLDQFTGRESILDVAVGLVGRMFREAHLNVHYRSRDESLIRFSNHYFYRDRLLTFPSPGGTNTWQGVFGVHVSEGRYDAGASRTNRKEAERAVDLAFQHMRTRPLGESLGVVALSRPQADLIERLIDERRLLERDMDARFAERTDEPFFVKNLENVQGDERDHMIISIGYGPTVESGAVPNRFGPLNGAGGERRLNVVVTRARQRVDLVYSLRPSDIHSQQEGARFLRRYLEYVANPTQAFEGQVTIDPSSEPESPFEEAVERALQARGYRMARQVGVSGYRIDLAILSEDGFRGDLGIECDGRAYHSAPAARDRDWLRQKVLEGLGWKIHRVWSTAWARNPEAELTRIEAALNIARARTSDLRDGDPPSFSQVAETSKPHADPPTVEVVPNGPSEVHLEDYVPAELPSPLKSALLQHETTANLVQMISRIVEVEGPVHEDVVIDRIRLRYSLGRVRGSTRERLENAIRTARGGRIRTDGTFLWSTDEQLERAPRKPVDGNIDHMPPTELRAVILTTARVIFGIARQGLVVEVARRLGFSRTGSRIAGIVDIAIQDLIDKGKLVERFGMLRPAE